MVIVQEKFMFLLTL